MAQTMMHLLIAARIYESKKVPIHSYGNFLMGSIAPDAVHVKAEYRREIKDISHYKFDSKSKMEYFDPFVRIYGNRENIDFVLGYLVHLLSDMIWYHSVRVPFKEAYKNHPAENMTMNQAYYYDCEQVDQLLCEDAAVIPIIRNIRLSTAYTLDGLIEKDDVGIWKEKLLADYDKRKPVKGHTLYISERKIRDYIEACSETCVDYLCHIPDLDMLHKNA